MKEYSIQEVLEMEAGTKVKACIENHLNNDFIFIVKVTDGGYTDLVDEDGRYLSSICYAGEMINLKFTLVDDEDVLTSDTEDTEDTEENTVNFLELQKYPVGTVVQIQGKKDKYYLKAFGENRIPISAGSNILYDFSLKELMNMKFVILEEEKYNLIQLLELINDLPSDKRIRIKHKDTNSDYNKSIIDILSSFTEENIKQRSVEEQYNIVIDSIK